MVDKTKELVQLEYLPSVHYTKPYGVTVFCGSSTGKNPIYMETAKEVGRKLALKGYHLVYGGGATGIMGAVSRSAQEAGTKVISVYPKGFSEVCLTDYETETYVTKDMHERKQTFATKSIGFIGLPGGLGTYEEIMEMATWNQLGIHRKFLAILNVNKFFDPLLAQLDLAVAEGFVSQETKDQFLSFDDIDSLIEELDKFDPNLKIVTPFLWHKE